MLRIFKKKDSSKKKVHDSNWIDLSDFISASGKYAIIHSEEMKEEVKRRGEGNSQKIYESMLEVCDERIDEFEELENRHCCCKKGCTYCCNQAIYLSPFEGKMLLASINKMTRNEKKMIRLKAESILDAIRENGIPMQLSPFINEMANNEMYLKLNLPCPLLGEDGSCVVYKNRPLTCQSFRNYGVPLECKGKISQNSYSFNEYHPTLRLPILSEYSNVYEMINMKLLSCFLVENI